jgi:NAD(P)-dependent dehydrogenase (short-subunit alcohol dehydrogenase family)
MLASLASKVVLVTGGTGAIGSAVCRTLARDGADVAFTYHQQAQAATELEAELGGLGRRCRHAPVEACDAAAVEAFVEKVVAELGRVDRRGQPGRAGWDPRPEEKLAPTLGAS